MGEYPAPPLPCKARGGGDFTAVVKMHFEWSIFQIFFFCGVGLKKTMFNKIHTFMKKNRTLPWERGKYLRKFFKIALWLIKIKKKHFTPELENISSFLAQKEQKK